VRRPCIVKRASTYIRSMMSILSICVAALTIQVRCQWWYCCVQVYNLRVQLNIKYMVKPIDQLFLVRKWQAKQFLSRRPGLPFSFSFFAFAMRLATPQLCRGLLFPSIVAQYQSIKKRTTKATGAMPAPTRGYCDGLSFARTCTVPVWPPPPEISLVNNPRKKLAIEPRGSLSCSSSMWPPAAPLPVPVETNCL